jgi:phosphoserine phosphatase RsbU/P
MSARQGALLLLLGVVGYGALAWLFPRYDPASQWEFQLDRIQLLTKAQAFASQQGVDVSTWKTAILTTRDRQYERYLRAVSPAAVEARFLSPLKAQIIFRDPNQHRTLRFLYSAQGQLLSFQRRGFTPTQTDNAIAPDKQIAEKAVTDLLGSQSAHFTFSTDTEPEKGSRKSVWSYTAPQPGLKIEAEAFVTGTMLTGAGVKTTLPAPYEEEITRREVASFAWFGVTAFVINVLAVLAALIVYFLGLHRKEIDHLSTLIFFVLALVLMLLNNGLTGFLDELKRGDSIQGITSPPLLTLLSYLLYFGACLFFALLLTAFWTAGEALTAKYQTGRLAVFASTLRGHWFTRPVAHNLAAGLLVGGFIAALPYLIASIGRLQTTPTELTAIHDLFLSPLPAFGAIIAATISGHLYYLILLFAFLAPALTAYLRTKWLAHVLVGLSGLVFLLELNPNQTTSLALKIAVTAAVFLAFALLYRYFDLLAVLTANMAAVWSINAFGLLLQPAPALHAAGVQSLIALGIFGLVAFVLTRVAPAANIEPRRLLHPSEDKAERERLKAEFGVARRAQENLLPAAAPEIPGFGIAALCRPARECGGDLYDFIPLADGKLGIVVADVSGKGVPAALYMTLTKGLLLSVAEEHSDPGEILRIVNKHLYEVCKRKVFVTLFFGVLDPTTKTLTYSRAGHNPPVWRKQSDQTTQFLKAAGLGLGLNAGKSFDRILAVEQINLSCNDLLIIYSDGITEAMNEQQEEYGEERLMKMAAVTDGLGAEESLSAIFAHVSNFLGRMLPQDDQTLVIVRVT